MVDRDSPDVQAVDMGESLGVRGTDHAHLVFDAHAGPGRRTASARRAAGSRSPSAGS